MKEEIWKDIFEKYQVSSLGNVRNKKTGKLISQRNTKKGYLQIDLYNKKKKTFRVHRLVAEVFIPNPANKLEVNHINGNKKDNRAINLEWVDCKENIKHAWRLGLYTKEKMGRKRVA